MKLTIFMTLMALCPWAMGQYLVLEENTMDADHGLVYFIRGKGHAGSATAFTAVIDDVMVCNLNNRRYSAHEVKPGRREFKAQFGGKKGKKKAEIAPIDIEAGKTYYVQMVMSMTFWTNDLFPVEITRNSAFRLVADDKIKLDQNCRVTFIDLSENPITLIWVKPDIDRFETFENAFVVKAGINTIYGIKTVNFTLNGIPTGNTRGFKLADKKEHNYDELAEQEIQLAPGSNMIKITVVDNLNNVEFLERSIFLASETTKLYRRDFALLFATDTYDEWGDLVNPVNDAKTIAKELEDDYGFNIELVENATQQDVILKLREYAQKSYLPNDQLFIFFAGHGQFDDLLGQGYIVTKDSKKADDAKTTYISHSMLRAVIDNIPSQHTFLAMDVCFGGTFDPSIARAGNRGEDDLYEELTTDEFVKRKLRFKTRKYLTSGGKQYVPDGRPGMHSPFARKFLEALRDGGGRDKVLTLTELYGWMERINPEPKAGGFGTDEPGSDFVFVVK